MTAIPGAIDRLIALSEAALPDVQVLDGPPSVQTAEDLVVIGFSPERIAVEGNIGDGGVSRERQSFQVVCLASSACGGPADMKPLRDRADEMFEAVRAAVRADQRLGGAVGKAQCQTTAVAQEHIHDEETKKVTSAVTIEFVVNCIVF